MSKFKSPNPVGPYSMFRKLSSGGWITSGQIPIDPENGTLNNNSVEKRLYKFLIILKLFYRIMENL